MDAIVEPQVLHPARSYADRLTLLGLVQARHPYPAGWSDQRAGILLQTKWQDRSGRAIAGADGRLATWWPTANWTLTVWQLEALQRRGEFADVVVAERPLALPDEVAGTILAYYDRLDAVGAAVGRGEIDDAGRAAALDELQRLLWRFHVHAITVGLAASTDLLGALPDSERRFAESWGYGIVGLLAAVNSPTHFEAVRGMQALLPMRLVAAADWDPAAATDLTTPQRGMIVSMRALYDAERSAGGPLERLLATAAATPTGAKAAGHHLFEVLLFGGADAAAQLHARLTTALTTPR